MKSPFSSVAAMSFVAAGDCSQGVHAPLHRTFSFSIDENVTPFSMLFNFAMSWRVSPLAM